MFLLNKYILNITVVVFFIFYAVSNAQALTPDNDKIWTTVGSAGTVNKTDIGKVFFNNSVVQAGSLLESQPLALRSARLNSADLAGTMQTALADTEVMIDTTKSSPPIQSTVRTCRPDGDYAEARARCLTLPVSQRAACIAQTARNFPPICEDRPVNFHSYVKWGGVIQALRPADDILIALDTFAKDTWAGRFYLDLNQVRGEVLFDTLTASFTTGPNIRDVDPGPALPVGPHVVLSLPLTSNDPTVICYRPGVLWCPDVQLDDMRVTVVLGGFHITDGGRGISYASATGQFDFDRDINNVPDFIVDEIKDVDAIIEAKVTKKLTAVFESDSVRAGLSTLILLKLQEEAEKSGIRWNSLTRIRSLTYQAGAMVMTYETIGVSR
jgi:hypothetical protein